MRLLLCAAITVLCAAGARGQSPWVLTWSDEFDSPSIDRTRWTFDSGGGGWGNRELESYTSRPENAAIENGMLVIRARAEDYTGTDGIARHYTSARLKSQGLFTARYGRIEARAKIPYGQGIWPAFWMLGADIATAGWPACGEIDIMENIGKEPATIHGTIHGPGYSGGSGITSSFSLPAPGRFADDFHLYAVEWLPGRIEFSVDGHTYKRITIEDLPPGSTWVFDRPFFLLLNLAIGGNWPGDPDSTTTFPQTLLVDYVRVYAPTRHLPPR